MRGTVPLHPGHRANTNARFGDRRILVEQRRHRKREDRFAGIAFEDVQDAIFPRCRYVANTGSIEKRDVRRVVVVEIIRSQLVPPLELPRLSVQRDNRVGEEIRSLAHRAF